MSKNLSDIFPPTEIGGGGGGIEEAPKTGKLYARKDEDWQEFEAGDIEPGNKDGEILTWSTAEAEWMPSDDIIVKGGNVGIGYDAPNAKLHVFDNTAPCRLTVQGLGAGNNAGINILGRNSSNTSAPWTIKTEEDLGLSFGNNVSEAMRIDSSGNVGIGTISPTNGPTGTFSGLNIQGTATNGELTALLVRNPDNTINTAGKVSIEMKATNSNRRGPKITAFKEGTYGDANTADAGLSFHTVANDVYIDALTIKQSGNVGIGTPPSSDLHVHDASASSVIQLTNSTTGVGAGDGMQILSSNSEMQIRNRESGPTTFYTSNTERVRIDASGNVGIGGEPGTRTAGEYLEQAKEQIASWKSTFDDRLKAEPKADKKAVTLEITDGDFGVFPTPETLAEKLAERAIGGGDAKLQVAGGGYFSGTVSAAAVQFGGYSFTAVGSGGAAFVPSGTGTTGTVSLGNASYKWLNGSFSGTVNANKFVGDGSGLTGLPSGGLTQSQGDARYVLKSGNSTVSGTITATDFVATSDERAKDNITTAPVGLIDSLKGREWDWKESGEKGSGVVAQELEQVLPHLVHTDDEGMKSVAYNGLVAYLIEEVKALRAEVEALK